jgi:hypothetical protein
MFNFLSLLYFNVDIFSSFFGVEFFKDWVNLIDQRPNPGFEFDASFNITPSL